MLGLHRAFDRDKSLLSVLFFSLQRIQFLANVSEKCLVSLAKTAKMETYAPDATVFVEGDPSHALYYIRTGDVELHSGQYNEKIVLGVGECFGELGFLNYFPKRISTAKAQNTCYLMVIEQEDFMKCIMNSKRDTSTINNDVRKMLNGYPHAKTRFENPDRKSGNEQLAGFPTWEALSLKESSRNQTSLEKRQKRNLRASIIRETIRSMGARPSKRSAPENDEEAQDNCSQA